MSKSPKIQYIYCLLTYLPSAQAVSMHAMLHHLSPKKEDP